MRSFFGTDIPQGVQWLLALILVLGLVVLFGVLLKRLAGGRLRVKGQSARVRQPRLGIVDIYDLDRQRQLVLLRRDNVEHLVMIGGPNDVVIETTISRAGQRVTMQPPVVEPEMELAPIADPAPPPPVIPKAATPEVKAPEPMAPPAIAPEPPTPPAKPPVTARALDTPALVAAPVAAQMVTATIARAEPADIAETPVVPPAPPAMPPSQPASPPPVAKAPEPAAALSEPAGMSEDEIDAVARELESALLQMAPPARETPPAPPVEVPVFTVPPVTPPQGKLASSARGPAPVITPAQPLAPLADAPGPASPEVPAPQPAAVEPLPEPLPAPQAQVSAAPADKPAPADQRERPAAQGSATPVPPDGDATPTPAEPEAPASGDPFSVGAIEAEFARLLNRTTPKPKS